ncbi:MAG TPA: hypothetical protein VKL22_04910, partial [Actinomycetota bacterium]|nr:hypothetical protein [Actinomycetota bacterium]
TARGRPYFEEVAVDRLLHEHESGIDHGQRIWALVQLELWHRMFVDRRVLTAPAAPGTPG